MTTTVVTTLPTPAPSPAVVDQPPIDPVTAAAAVITILLALAAAVVGYRVIRGGRGL